MSDIVTFGTCCNPADGVCPPVPHFINGVATSSIATEGSDVYIDCDPGYRTPDNRPGFVITCYDRAWTQSQDGTCIRQCLLLTSFCQTEYKQISR